MKSTAKYENYQKKWEARSSVRTRPRKFIDFSKKGYFFPEDKQIVLLNQDVINLGQKIKEDILLQSFYKYLNDIVFLETQLINSACSKIIYDDLVVKYDHQTKLNAYTVIIDEYYHVYLAKDMILQMDQRFPNINKFSYPISDAHNAVILIKNKLSKKYRDIFEIIAVCIFETTLVRELVEFFNNESIHPSIKYYINDHMNDEARHYYFFFELLHYTWKELPKEYQDNIGKYVAQFIKLYLNINSEKSFNFYILNKIFEDKKKSSFIIENLYKGFDITPDIPIVKNVLHILKKSNLLENFSVNCGFQNIGWKV